MSYSANCWDKEGTGKWEGLCSRVIQNYLELFNLLSWLFPGLKVFISYSWSWLEFFYYFLGIEGNQQPSLPPPPLPSRKEGIISWYFQPCVKACKSTDIKYNWEMCLVYFLGYGHMSTGRSSRTLISAIDGLY